MSAKVREDSFNCKSDIFSLIIPSVTAAMACRVGSDGAPWPEVDWKAARQAPSTPSASIRMAISLDRGFSPTCR